MANCRFRGVAADGRGVEVKNDRIEFSFDGLCWHTIHYQSVLTVWHGQYGRTPIKVKNSKSKSGYVWVPVTWHSYSDAAAFCRAVTALSDRAAADFDEVREEIDEQVETGQYLDLY